MIFSFPNMVFDDYNNVKEWSRGVRVGDVTIDAIFCPWIHVYQLLGLG